MTVRVNRLKIKIYYTKIKNQNLKNNHNKNIKCQDTVFIWKKGNKMLN